MRNLNNSNILTSNERINRTVKKNVEKIILKIWVQYVHSSVKVGSFFAPSSKGYTDRAAYNTHKIKIAPSK